VKRVFLRALTGGIPGAGTPKGSLTAAGFAAAVPGFAVVAAGVAAVVAGFADVLAAAAGLAAGAVGGVVVWALAAMVQAANIRIKAVCFIAFSNSGWCLKEVYQALRPFCTLLAIVPSYRLSDETFA
jgi:hypothetical protein